MQARYENWTNGLNGDWCISRQRFFGVPFPVWYPIRRTRARRPRRVRSRARRVALPIDPSTDVPTGLSRRPARRAGRIRRRSRCDGHLGDLVAVAADRLRLAGRRGSVRARRFRWICGRRRTTSSARGCSIRCCASHLEHDSLPWTQRRDLGLGARSRSQEDVEVQGQRRHAAGAARGARVGRRPLLGGERPARHRHRVRHRTRCASAGGWRSRCSTRRSSRSARPSRRAPIAAPVDRAMLDATSARARRRGDRGVRGLRLRARAAADGNVLLALLRRLPRARQGPALRRAGCRRRAARRTPRSPPRCRSCCGCSRRFCRLSPKKSGRGGRTDRFIRRAWPTSSELESLLADNAARREQADERAYQWATDVLFEVRKQRSEAKQPLKVPITSVTITADADSVALMPLVEARSAGRRCASRPSSSLSASRGRSSSPATRPLQRLVILPLDRALSRHRAPGARGRRRRRRRHDRSDRCRQTSGARRRSSSRRSASLAGLDVAFESVPAARAPASRSSSNARRRAVRAGRQHRGRRRRPRGRCSSASGRRSTSCSACRASRRCTRQFVDAAGGRITMLDTRKTTPTLRALEKYAVRAGGGTNHRIGLFDAHPDQGQPHPRSPAASVRPSRARASTGRTCRSKSRRETLAQVDEALAAGADIILLDNMTTPTSAKRRQPRRADARRSRSPAASRSSGSRSLRRPARISCRSGALTHSAPAVDISFEIEPV